MGVQIKLRNCEKVTKFEKNLPLFWRLVNSRRFFKFLWPFRKPKHKRLSFQWFHDDTMHHNNQPNQSLPNSIIWLYFSFLANENLLQCTMESIKKCYSRFLTKYEERCDFVTETLYNTTYENRCFTKYDQKCDTVMETKCEYQ